VLENSSQPLVTIAQDWEMLKLYIELQKEVMENKFDYESSIDERLLTGGYKIPALLLQPFVENSIQHGLRHKQGNAGLLRVSLQLHGNTVEAVIEDNGIGRKKAEEINTQRQSQKNSMGVDISKSRVQQFSATSSPAIINYTDLEINGQPAGTKVNIRFSAKK
jgi:LytS/YehU family sensor histidine kinase